MGLHLFNNLGIRASRINSVATGFITEWTVAGDATARTVTLPLYNLGVYNCTINWGDGTADSTVTAYNDADRIHTYASDGTYVIEIKGECPAFYFNNGGDKLKIRKVLHWGTAGVFGGFKQISFYGCTNLSSLGTGSILLATGYQLSLIYMFRNCSSLTSIPSGLLKNFTASNDFGSVFYGCSGLTSLPADLFRYNIGVTNFNFAFFNCSNLTSLPTDLFRYNINVTSFGSSFYGCSKLTSLPTDLFRYNTSVTSFMASNLGVFQNCTALENAPMDYSSTIYLLQISMVYLGTAINFSKMQIFFTPMANRTTRFLNKSINFAVCFYRLSFSGTQGTAPDLWNCDFGTGTPTKSICWAGAGNSLTSLTNYGDIPVDWKNLIRR